MAQVTDADEKVARAATDLLREQGRHELEVTPSQVVRWRLKGLFELPPGPRRGRSNFRRYPESAPELAAQFRILLETRPKIDEALLIAFSAGYDVGVEGVRTSISEFVGGAALRLSMASRPTKRSERFTLPGPRSKYEEIAKGVVVDVLLEREPMNPDWAEILSDRFGGSEATEHLVGTGGVERLREVLRSAGLVGLSRTVKQASRDDLRWAAGTARTLIDFARSISVLYEVTGTTDAQLVHRALASAGKLLRTKRLSGEFGLAFLAPAILLMAPDSKARKQLSEVVQDCEAEIPRLKALIAASEELPEKWRRSLGPGGAAMVATLPEHEGEELLTQLRDWLATHPVEAGLVGIQTNGGSEKATQ